MNEFTFEKFEHLSAKEIWNLMIEFTELINDAPNRQEKITLKQLSKLHKAAKARECNFYRAEDKWCRGKDAPCDGWCTC